MTALELQRIAVATAYSYGLDPALVCAICDHESGGWNPWAIRYEPGFYAKYIANNTKLGSLTQTEKTARAFSYGLMQVMGQVAREQRFTGKYLTELCDPLTNLNQGCMKLRACMTDAAGNTREALLKYNGGANKEYPDLVLAKMEKYK